jgi:pimeloyl-ACP methyl ester carboxylesterase
MAPGGVPLVFVHGMYLTGLSWAPWVHRAEAAGWTCHAPSWPFHEGDPAVLRASIDPRLGRLRFGDVTTRLQAFIDRLPERPILVGHSIGGLLVQKLVNDGYARAAVSISSAPPRGVLSFDPHFFRANFPHTNPFAGSRPVVMTRERFRYAFANTSSAEEVDAIFERLVVPESRNVPRSTLTSQGAIDFRREHVPMLFLAGDADHLTPAAMVETNVRRYAGSAGRLDFVRLRDRSHLLCNAAGWEDVADLALAFAAEN